MESFGELRLVSTATEERLSPETSHAHFVGDEEQTCKEPLRDSRLASRPADLAGSNGRQARSQQMSAVISSAAAELTVARPCPRHGNAAPSVETPDTFCPQRLSYYRSNRRLRAACKDEPMRASLNLGLDDIRWVRHPPVCHACQRTCQANLPWGQFRTCAASRS